jgi:copper chaperone CopZ
LHADNRLSSSLAALALLPLAAIPAIAQTPAATASQGAAAKAQQAPAGPSAPPSLFIAAGTTTDEAIARLRAALVASPGVEQLDIAVHADRVTLRIKGTPMGSLLAARAKTVGFALRPMPESVFAASNPSAGADMQKLRAALGKVDGVEQVDIAGPVGSAEVRILGDVKSSALAAAAKSAGYELRRTGYFVAAGSGKTDDIVRLRFSLEKVTGVARLEVRQVAGGTMLGVQGVMEDADLSAVAKSVGYELRSMVDPSGGPFLVSGIANSGDEEKLRKALQTVPGIGYFMIEDTPDGTQLTLPISIAKPTVVAAAAKAAGFELHPVYPFFESSPGADMERNTPPASNDRILEDLTKVGDAAPDFTLITKDGQSKIGLSDYRGKKPVVLIFGSYT